MMHKILAVLISTSCGILLTLSADNLLSIAYQTMTPKTMRASIHLDSDETPKAKQANLIWFRLALNEEETISPSRCACQVAIHDSDSEVIVDNLPLSVMSIDGNQTISTVITFPTPGTYTLVLSGESNDGSFDPFTRKFPITVNPEV